VGALADWAGMRPLVVAASPLHKSPPSRTKGSLLGLPWGPGGLAAPRRWMAMRRLVIRFKDGSTTSLDLVPGREREDLLRHLRHFPRKEVASVEEQVYDPEHPKRFRYVRREDLEGLLLSYKGEALGESV
jgi:hypothetical protein